MNVAPTTLFDKIWDQHVVKDLGGGWVLLQIDRHLLHDLGGPMMLQALKDNGLAVHNPELVFATPDHTVSSAPGRTGAEYPSRDRWRALQTLTSASDIRLFDLGQRGQGIVHVMAPELGLVTPGMTLICGDSHTCTNGALGAIAFGIGTSEGTHALATGVLRQQKPACMRMTIDGVLGAGVAAKDVILHLIYTFGTAAGVGHAVEYGGSTVAAMDVEARLTLCNPTVEFGAKCGIIAPDDTVFEYLRGRPFAPTGDAFARAVCDWRVLKSDVGATFNREEHVRAEDIAPTITWGTTPEQGIPVGAMVPDPSMEADPARRENGRAALEYMGLSAGQPIEGIPIDIVFIGSCTNSRLSDLRSAASIARNHRVADGVMAWVVPGSESVKRAAEAEGLDHVFREAGFQWREPGCSMCVAANGETAPPQARVVSTSNRNFMGRQGPGARTHLASPAMAAAAAIRGAITDVRTLL